VGGDEWRVEVELEEEHHGFSLGERLRAHDLDEEARRRLESRVIVTKDGPHVFLYAASEEQAQEAARVARELVEAEGRSARFAITRWHPDEEAWKDAAIPLPGTDAERAAERALREQAEEREADAEGSYEWEVNVDMPGRSEAAELERELRDEGLDVHRLWRYVTIGAPTEERANELAARLRDALPAAADVSVEANPEELPTGARFAFFGPWR
jgi:hypothetical protein